MKGTKLDGKKTERMWKRFQFEDWKRFLTFITIFHWIWARENKSQFLTNICPKFWTFLAKLSYDFLKTENIQIPAWCSFFLVSYFLQSCVPFPFTCDVCFCMHVRSIKLMDFQFSNCRFELKCILMCFNCPWSLFSRCFALKEHLEIINLIPHSITLKIYFPNRLYCFFKSSERESLQQKSLRSLQREIESIDNS